MAFSLVVELLNMRFRKKSAPVALRQKFEVGADPGESAPTTP
jgi:hypothetical protein